uniref:Uncharacterized protein n=1 Tax=Hordeum vulgare subsp. vulgare TaxID=112509 RepID=A0A8I6Y3P2_HORVV
MPPHTVYASTAFFFFLHQVCRMDPSCVYNCIQLKSVPVFAMLCPKGSTLISYRVHMGPKKRDVSSMVACSHYFFLLLGEKEEFYCGCAPDNDSVFLFMEASAGGLEPDSPRSVVHARARLLVSGSEPAIVQLNAYEI